MPKKIEDIVPKGKKSIRDIPIPVRRNEAPYQPPQPAYTPPITPRPVEPTSVLPKLRNEKTEWQPHSQKKKKRLIVTGGIMAVLLLAFGGLSLRNGATLSYAARSYPLSLNDEFSVHQSPSSGDLGYSVIKMSGDKSAIFTPTGEETVSVKASGRVIIYNEQSNAQSLIKTTRLETSDGKIYRITSDVSVPAKGSIEVTAEADKAGESYNIGLTDFTIPGLKGTPRFELVYARSKTAISGGFEGTRKKVDSADLLKAKPELESSLKNELIELAKTQIPAEYVLFPDLSTITYESLPQENTPEGQVKYSERGNLNAVILKRDDLSQFLALKKLTADPGEVEIVDYTKLRATFSDPAVNLLKDTSIKIKFSGETELRARVDEPSLKQDLAGKTESDVKAVIENYPSISDYSVSFRPFWKSSFPKEAGKIRIQRNNAN